MSNKEQLTRDKNNQVIQAELGFQTKDATGTPLNSPLAYAAIIITLTPPNDATSIVLSPSTNLRVSEVSNMATYYVVTASSAEIFPCANGNPLYIVRDSASGTVNFRYNLA